MGFNVSLGEGRVEPKGFSLQQGGEPIPPKVGFKVYCFLIGDPKTRVNWLRRG